MAVSPAGRFFVSTLRGVSRLAKTALPIYSTLDATMLILRFFLGELTIYHRKNILVACSEIS